ncbi:unnamed protein product, partial [Mesorhabditis belari]|uniref:Uncharacterized protein n=1 Tax=Mesorhabditis belari TaxID=2138241 RepID=A0AAF3ESM7_9BILA
MNLTTVSSLLFSTTQATFTTTHSQAIHGFDRTKCNEFTGYYWMIPVYELKYGWNGLPFPSPINDSQKW